MSNAEQLRQQAEHCQRLAAGVANPGLAASLLAMARSYLERAAKLDTVAAMGQRQQAEHCQRLAAGVPNPGLAASLLAMARSYLERAAKLDTI